MFNLFIVLIITFIIALILIYLISAHDRRMKDNENAKLYSNTVDSHTLNYDFRQFTKICMDICDNLKLDVQEVYQSEGNEIIAKAVSQDPITAVQFLIVGYFLHPQALLESGKIMEISDQIISERISKGIIITSGKIDDTVKLLPELAPITFLDGSKVKELIEKYKINF